VQNLFTRQIVSRRPRLVSGVTAARYARPYSKPVDRTNPLDRRLTFQSIPGEPPRRLRKRRRRRRKNVA